MLKTLELNYIIMLLQNCTYILPRTVRGGATELKEYSSTRQANTRNILLVLLSVLL